MTKQVVIIGGGASGKHCADLLVKRKDVQLTMISGNRFVEWPIAMTKVLANPEEHGKALAPNPQKFEIPGVTYKYGAVTQVDPTAKTVTLKDGLSLSYDALVVATGFQMPVIYPELGATLQERRAQVAEVGAAIKKAQCVAICGAGAVGLELAGDIRVANPGKRIVLLSRDKLLKSYPEGIQAQVQAQLKAMSIEVVTGNLKDAPTDLRLEAGELDVSGTKVSYDVFFPAYSRGPNTGFLAPDLLDGKGFIKVNDFLQSETSREVFAVGVSGRDEGFVGLAKLGGQWKTVGHNVGAFLQGKPLKKHAESMPFMKRPPLVALGHGKTGWATFDCTQVPPPCRLCCCCGLGGFPCCPPPCCWPCCGPCACGSCGGPAAGWGPAAALAGMEFKTGGFHFKGLGEAESAPAQQTM